MASVRRFLTPGWVLLHVFTVAVVITMILLGRWQLIVSDRKHFDLQNFGYAIQWWLFSAFALYLWWRFVRDARREAGPELVADAVRAAQTKAAAPVAYRRYVMPTAADVAYDAEDDVQASYNEYLRSLHHTTRD